MKTGSAEYDDMLASIGAAVVLCHTVESCMRMCLLWVFPGDTPRTMEMIEVQTKADQKRTIGQFVAKLRERVGVQEDFDEMLSRFIENRNKLIHRPQTSPDGVRKRPRGGKPPSTSPIRSAWRPTSW
jgi:hypothetical protein